MYTSFASEAIARRINLLFRITMRHLRLEMKKLGIGAGDYSFLAILHFFPGSSQDELSRHLDVDKSYTARALAKLEKMGLVERRPDPNEHRIRRVHLSQRSKDMEDDFFQVLMNWHHILIKDMDEREVELVRQGMDKMLANARAHMNGPHPSDSPVNFADSEKKETAMKNLKRLVFIVPVAIGIALFLIIKANKPHPVREADRERVRAVRVMALEKTAVVPRVTGYGYVRPEKTWQAIPEVSGQIIAMNEKIKKGYFIKEGEVLFQIDTRALGLAESKGVAEVMNLDAQLRELDQSRKNTEHLLVTEKKALAIAGQELTRKRTLFKKQFISASDLEREETNFLARQTAVNNLENILKLIPAQKKALKARRRSGESSVAERRLDMAKTQIRAPFNGRISKVNVERFQFAPAGSVILEAQSIDRAEVPVHLSPGQLFKLLPRNYEKTLDRVPDIESITRAMGISARVRLPLDGDHAIEWEGRFSRTGEAMDPATGTLTFFIGVDNPYAGLIPGKRPPLATNMYVEVELSGQALADRFALPRSAVHGASVYICTKDNRLEIRKVDPEFTMAGLAVLSTGVAPGEILVLSDLVPAVAGMKLLPEPDLETAARVRASAAGEGI